VQEAGHRFEVCLSDVSDTGLLLDRRTIRAMIEKEAAGKRFLNLFGTTGAATVSAAAGGAVSTATIDLSASYLDRARRNMELNRFTQPWHQYIRANGIEYLAGLGQRRPSFDLVLIDPPTYAGVTQEHTAWDIARDHVELLNLVLDHLAPGGKIFLSTTSRRFKLATEALSRATVRDISRQTVPADFRNKRIHQCFTLWLPADHGESS
jgi:23S rRNA G2069 N7-methylase RlmK/C1962 C5-methylase RlmI